jgi:hypothetical protein
MNPADKRWPEIQFAVLRGRPAVNRHLRRFGQSVAHYREFPGSANWQGIFAVRNAIFRWFLAECALPWLVMLDDDIVVTAESEPFLASTADVTGPRVVGATDGIEVHPHTLSAAAVKLSRPAVAALGACWQPPADGNCGCPILFNACIQASIRPVKAGAVGHRVPVTILPGPVFLLDADVRGL